MVAFYIPRPVHIQIVVHDNSIYKEHPIKGACIKENNLVIVFRLNLPVLLHAASQLFELLWGNIHCRGIILWMRRPSEVCVYYLYLKLAIIYAFYFIRMKKFWQLLILGGLLHFLKNVVLLLTSCHY